MLAQIQKRDIELENHRGQLQEQVAVRTSELLMEKNKAEAADEMEEAIQGEDLDKQFDELESKGEVSDKMAALKAKMAKKKESASA